MNPRLPASAASVSLAAVSLSLPAGAAVVSNGPGSFPWNTQADGPFSIDFNADGTTDFSTASVRTGPFTDWGENLQRYFIAAPGAVSSSNGTAFTYSGIVATQANAKSAAFFSGGEVIPTAVVGSYNELRLLNNALTTKFDYNLGVSGEEMPSYGGQPLLNAGMRSYVGVIFAGPSGFHAGWVDLEGAGATSIIVHGWGWETTPNTPILAGAVGVPTADPSGGGAGTAGSVAAARAAVNAQIGQYRAMQANQAHARRVAEAKRLQAARR